MATLQDRMIRAAKLDAALYEEVEADRDAMGQATAVVLLSAVAAGVGAGGAGFLGLVGAAVAALVGWYLWAFLTYFIGARLLPEPQTSANVGELLRTIGFSASPGVLRVAGLIPGFSEFIFFVTGVWMLIAMVIAVRQALDYRSTWRAVGVCVIGWVVQMLIFAAVLGAFGIAFWRLGS